MKGDLASASSFPPALAPRLDEMVGRLNGEGVFPALIVLSDGRGGFGLFR